MHEGLRKCEIGLAASWLPRFDHFDAVINAGTNREAGKNRHGVVPIFSSLHRSKENPTSALNFFKYPTPDKAV